jgi:hypothetical protein
MAKKRLSEVILEECLPDGVGCYAAFKDLSTLETEYPKVRQAIEDEAELRPQIGGAKGVLEKIARPFLDEELGKLHAGDKPPAKQDKAHDEPAAKPTEKQKQPATK